MNSEIGTYRDPKMHSMTKKMSIKLAIYKNK